MMAIPPVLYHAVLALLFAAWHYASLMVLVEVFKTSRSLQPGRRHALATLSVVMQGLGIGVWVGVDAARRASRATIVYALLWWTLIAYTTVAKLRPQYGNLTQEEYLFYYSAALAAAGYLVFYSATGLWHLGCVVVERFRPAVAPTQTGGGPAGGAAQAAGRTMDRRRQILAVVGVGIVYLLMRSMTQGEEVAGAGKARTTSVQPGYHAFLRGILGEHWNPCPTGAVLPPQPTAWPIVLPRRVMNFWVGGEYCEDALPQWETAFDESTSKSFPPPPSQAKRPPFSWLDERTGLLIVRADCGVAAGSKMQPSVIALDMNRNQLGALEDFHIGGDELAELLPFAKGWHRELGVAFGRGPPRGAGHPAARRTVDGVPLRYWGSADPRHNRSVPGLPHDVSPLGIRIPRGDLLVEYDLGSAKALSAREAVELVRNAADIAGLAEAAAKYSTMLEDDLKRFLSAGGNSAPKFIVVSNVVTAQTIVKCGTAEEHHGFPVALARNVSAQRNPSSGAGSASSSSASSTPKSGEGTTNVVVVILDAVGRPTFSHYLPSTTEWFQQRRLRSGGGKAASSDRQQAYELFEFPGMTTVGHSTFPNVGSLWTGLTATKVSSTKDWGCAALPTMLEAQPGGRRFASSIIDGMCASATVRVIGLDVEDRPSGSFGGPFGSIGDLLMGPLCDTSYGFVTSNFHGPYSMRPRCFGRGTVARYLLQYQRAVLLQHGRLQRLGIRTLSSIQLLDGHEGTRTVLRTVDDELRAHFVALEAMGVFDTSAVIFMSDHGNHMGPFYESSDFGRRERTMPVFMMAVPDTVLDQPASSGASSSGSGRSSSGSSKVRKNLAENQRQPIMTMLDAHETIRDLLGAGSSAIPIGMLSHRSVVRKAIAKRSLVGNALLVRFCSNTTRRQWQEMNEGQSLLRPFQAYSSCSDAGAEEHCSHAAVCEGRGKPS